jgi:hypothetical protein
MRTTIVWAVAVCLALSACSTPIKPVAGRSAAAERQWQLSNLAKTDIDEVVETHLEESLASLRVLMEKLYRRNPRELRKGGFATVDEAVKRAFDYNMRWRFPELEEKRGIELLAIAFKPEYPGDRVFAFIVGLGSMIHLGYNEQMEFFAFDTLDPQALYNAARNVEVAAWKISTARDAKGELLLLSSEIGPEVRNLSFEREFGKLIAYQDVMARVMAQRSNRTLRMVFQSTAGVFLPIR